MHGRTSAMETENHYSDAEIYDRMTAALHAAGKSWETIGRDDIAAIDEFHIRGRDATRELARLAELSAGWRVLDVGCGLGGAARTLAAEFGCHVTGIDLTREFCTLAIRLNEHFGMGERIEIRRADALDLPFAGGSFDAAVIEHVTMNIADKHSLWSGIRRVLRPRGTLALYEICAGIRRPEYLPAPWSDGASNSHLLTPEALRRTVEEAGFSVSVWRDVSDRALSAVRSLLERLDKRPADAAPVLSINLLMRREPRVKIANMVRNLEEDRIRLIQGVAAA